MNFSSIKKTKEKKGFTIFELIISIAIFAFMSALILAKYGNFNQGVLLTNLAYDIALSIRNAQSYGLNVKSTNRATNDFDRAYGVHFEKNSIKFTFFADDTTGNGVGVYNTGDVTLSDTTIKRGSTIADICVYPNTTSANCEPVDKELDITFRRPDPNAIMKASVDGSIHTYSRARITVAASDGTIKTVTVNSTGQISVQ